MTLLALAIVAFVWFVCCDFVQALGLDSQPRATIRAVLDVAALLEVLALCLGWIHLP